MVWSVLDEPDKPGEDLRVGVSCKAPKIDWSAFPTTSGFCSRPQIFGSSALSYG